MPLPRSFCRRFSPSTTLAASTMGVKGPSLAAPMVVTAARDAVAERIGACTTKPDAHASRTSMRRIRSAIPDLYSARKIRDGSQGKSSQVFFQTSRPPSSTGCVRCASPWDRCKRRAQGIESLVHLQHVPRAINHVDPVLRGDDGASRATSRTTSDPHVRGSGKARLCDARKGAQRRARPPRC